ncbi:hypothetical protein BY458DRAFT_430091 [Sporodiniella umbellata]|nr:hypothetical protein BY458DRAFT_430091 [Sporodiniella umbellata]
MANIENFLQTGAALFKENNYDNVLSVAQALIECGSCSRCILRFLGCSQQTLYAIEEKHIEEYVPRAFESLVAETYQVNDISLSCTLPVSTLIRNHLLKFYLKDKGLTYTGLDDEGFVKDPKNIFKNFLGEHIEKNSQYKVDNEAGFRMAVVLDHEASSQEHMILAQLEKPLLKIKTIRQKRRRVVVGDSRQCISYALLKLDPEEAKKVTSIPPSVPTEKPTISSVTFTNTSTYVGGRYLKFSREYSQTPWNVRGAKLTENSVSECFELIKIRHKADDAKFCTAGREDANVRMLGTGRPFFLELINPRIPRLTDQEYQELENEINESPEHKNSVQVRHLTYIKPKDTKIIKEGEEKKTKKYRALVWLSEPLTDELTQRINEAGSKVCPIIQKTPVRVFQRRAAIDRPKTIYAASIVRVSDKPEEAHFGVYEMHAQAGTYIKEFVHGDLGRTQPNLANLAGIHSADLLELDVVDVDLVWPPVSKATMNENNKRVLTNDA